MNKKGYQLSHVIIIIICTAIIAAVTTGIIITSSFSANGKSYSALVLDENVQEFLEVYSKLTNDYYEDVDKKAIIQNAINSMTAYLDENYTTYLNSENANDLMQELNGKYTGIGVSILGNEVVDIYANSPADRSGIEIGDIIISINETKVEGATSKEISNLIKKNGDNVVLAINRNGVNYVFRMKTEEFKVPSVEAKMIEDTTIGYIKMTVFSSNLTNETQLALNDLKKQGMDHLIIDLRDNTGGYLDQAKSVASLFLEKDKPIYYLDDKEGLKETLDDSSTSLDIPIVVLTNGMTASAAEILTGALKYSYGATLVGTKTYGKGKVQHTLTLNDNDMVKYTSSKWLMPNKECVDKIGITPDYIIENEYIYDEENPLILISSVDKQLNKAIELLK